MEGEKEYRAEFTMIISPGIAFVAHFFLIYVLLSGVLGEMGELRANAIYILVFLVWLIAIWWVSDEFYASVKRYSEARRLGSAHDTDEKTD